MTDENIKAVHDEFDRIYKKNKRGEYGNHTGKDPEFDCLACERYNEDILRAGGPSGGGWTEEELVKRREQRKAEGAVVTTEIRGEQ